MTNPTFDSTAVIQRLQDKIAPSANSRSDAQHFFARNAGESR
jgi:hypothetical protein